MEFVSQFAYYLATGFKAYDQTLQSVYGGLSLLHSAYYAVTDLKIYNQALQFSYDKSSMCHCLLIMLLKHVSQSAHYGSEAYVTVCSLW